MLLINVNERPLSPAMQTVVCGVPMTASRPELFRQATLAISGGFKRGDPRRFSALR